MARRILIPALAFAAVSFYFQGSDAGIGPDRSPAPLSVAAGGQESDGFLCAECEGPDPDGDRGRHRGAFFAVFPERDDRAGAGGPDGSPNHGMGPVLSSLCDILTLSRPPPSARGDSSR